jgi:hypothetical protein
MISQVRQLITLLSNHLGDGTTPFPIVRKEQSGLKQVYPYAGYKVLTVNGDPYQNKGQIDNIDPTKITYHYDKVETAIVSLSFYITENASGVIPPTIDLIYTKASEAIEYLQIEGKEAIKELQIVVELFDTTIQDRTLYLDTVYEYQLGFDFRVKALKGLDLELDAVDVDATIDGIEYHYE